MAKGHGKYCCISALTKLPAWSDLGELPTHRCRSHRLANLCSDAVRQSAVPVVTVRTDHLIQEQLISKSACPNNEIPKVMDHKTTVLFNRRAGRVFRKS